ncbi:MAG: hypothetical protein GX045_05330 [Clostridiaceae bacterium]|jgi:hypothetical protein|nr:hypothetical protein [Clostridiaceae bacterium]
MGFICKALFPYRKVSLMAVDRQLDHDIKTELKKYVAEILEIPPHNNLQPPVSGHPDMQLVHIRENILACQPDMPAEIILELKKAGFQVYTGEERLKPYYPLNIAYNVAVIGNVAFHNTKYTDPVLADILKKSSIRLVHVNQGYTKCSILPVTPESIITADPTIEKAALSEGLDVLKLPPQRKIRLPGYNYGFIGGTAGFVNNNTLAFAGDINMLDNKEEVKMFLKKYNIGWVCLKKDFIGDYGGLIPLCQL